jgi:hypothetical protein
MTTIRSFTNASSYWADLLDKFRGPQETERMLRADWDYIAGSGGQGRWRLAGAVSRTAAVQFEMLARRGASALRDAGGCDLLIIWLEALKRASGNFELIRDIIELNADGSEGAYHQTGTISRLFEASAEYCRERESEALQTEFAEERDTARGDKTKASELAPCSAESVGRQINRYREDCRMTIEDLGENIGLDARTVQRHVADACIPFARNLTAYERVFSKLLNKEIVIKKMP